MPMRLHEIHPALAHYPVALLPAAVLADVVGHLRRDPAATEMGRRLMPIAFASAAMTGLAGFLAQGAVRTEGRSRDLLTTHRTLNIAATGLAGALALWRRRRARPTPGYLALGLAGAALVTYTAYLGGKLVYGHGVGVEAAGGVDEDRSPPVTADGLAARAAVEATARGIRDSAAGLAAGEVVSHLTRH